jgi:hypothetical protein
LSRISRSATNSDMSATGLVPAESAAAFGSWAVHHHQQNLSAPLPERPPARLPCRVQLRVLFFSDLETDGFRAQLWLHHVWLAPEASSDETTNIP